MPYPLDTLDTLILLGLASGVLSFAAYLPYIRDTLAGRTQPQRASWLIWSVLSTIALCGQIYEGASASLWFAGVQVSATVLIFGLSLRWGVGGVMDRRDAVILALAGAGVVLWSLTDTPAYALAITITISLLGGSVTVAKAFQAPRSETLSTWTMGFVASGLAIAAVGQIDPVLMAYPAYLLLLNGAIVAGRLRRAVQVAPL
jgi:hypothetical protein